jgi:glutathione S-transferase
MAIKYSGITVEHREVVLADKPEDMLSHSPKGTVPVLILPDGTVIDESYDIIRWALDINDPDNWLPKDKTLLQKTNELIEINDFSFKAHLDQYKYATSFPEQSPEHYRDQAEEFLRQLESLLGKSRYLLGNEISMVDISIMPFIRQFAFVDRRWFDQSQYKKLQAWLDHFLHMELFDRVMKKYPQWTLDSMLVEF